MAPIPIALQLYTVRDETNRDFAGTLRRVAEIGYRAVEMVEGQGWDDLSAADVRGLLDNAGLKAPSIHVRLDRLQSDLPGVIDECQLLGCTYLVLPWLSPEQRDAAALDALAPHLDKMGRQCRDHGIFFAYHNHDFEFVPSNGSYLLDRLLAATDPELVQLELDVYWAAYAGVDPVAYLQRYAGRVPLVHLKDLAADRSFAEVGDGTLDIPAIRSAAAEAGAQWYVVEHDRPTLPSLESAKRSLQNLRAMGM